jgi:hypothetical protein
MVTMMTPDPRLNPVDSQAEYFSRPLPVFTKLVSMLRNIPAMEFVFAKFAVLLRREKGSDKPLISKSLSKAPAFTRNTLDQHAPILESSGDSATTGPNSNDQSDREKLIHRRWTETGIKMWNPDVHGAGHAALNIQGRVELLPVKPGETLPGYDTLEFKMVRSYVNGQAVNRIVCEGVVVDPPGALPHRSENEQQKNNAIMTFVTLNGRI